MLKLENITFQHRGSPARYDFTLAAGAGEIVCVMGASGSGKSTLLDLIAGFHIPDGGTMTWQDKNLIPLPPEDRPVTILFQNHNLFDHLSAARNVAIGVNASGRITSQQQTKVSDALETVGLKGMESQRASTLSGGQQQRVALARSIVRERPILLLDEPFSGLDEAIKSDMLDLVRGLALSDNRCVLMVTHDSADCAAIATRRLEVSDGRLIPAQ